MVEELSASRYSRGAECIAPRGFLAQVAEVDQRAREPVEGGGSQAGSGGQLGDRHAVRRALRQLEQAEGPWSD